MYLSIVFTRGRFHRRNRIGAKNLQSLYSLLMAVGEDSGSVVWKLN